MIRPSRLSLPAARPALILLALASALILAAALVGQYGFGLHPCHLCILQRYPYLGVIGIGIFAAVFLRREKWLRAALLLCVPLLLTGAGIAGYHAGVEAKIFPGPTSCTTDISQPQTLEEMRAAILNAPLVACDEPLVHFLGISLAGWNLLLYVFLAVFTLLTLRRKTSS